MRQLDDMTAKTICNHFTSVLAEFGLPSTVVADFGPQYISEMFKEKCNNSGIALIFHYSVLLITIKPTVWQKDQLAYASPYGGKPLKTSETLIRLCGCTG